MGHVVFTRPDEFDRLTDRPRNLRRLDNKVQFQATAKTASKEGRLQGDVFRFDAQGSGNSALRALLKLGGADQQNLAIVKARREVHRLERRVGLQWRDVLRLNHFGRTFHGASDIAHWFGNFQDLAARRCIAGSVDHRSGTQSGADALIPLHAE